MYIKYINTACIMQINGHKLQVSTGFKITTLIVTHIEKVNFYFCVGQSVKV